MHEADVQLISGEPKRWTAPLIAAIWSSAGSAAPVENRLWHEPAVGLFAHQTRHA